MKLKIDNGWTSKTLNFDSITDMKSHFSNQYAIETIKVKQEGHIKWLVVETPNMTTRLGRIL